MMNEESTEYPANNSQLYVRVPNVDDIHVRALAHGAISIMAPNDRSFGDRLSGITDPFGNIWWIAHAIND